MSKKKIIIIARIILPAQNPRSYRATELAKELARQGNLVVLYAVLGKYDYSDFEEKNNVKVMDIGKMLFATYDSDEKFRYNLIDKVLNKLLKKIIEFPDIELMFRIPKIIRKEKDADMVISVAAPYTIHWGCALSKSVYKKKFPKKWIADCGDPFMGNKFVKRPFYFKYIEQWFCRKADQIVVPFEGAIEGYYPEFRKKITVIPQGFRFDNVRLNQEVIQNSVPTFAYAGAFYHGIRNPSPFLDYISNLKMSFKFIVYTKNNEFLDPYLKLLGDRIEILGYISREKLLYELSKMDFLINFENNSDIHLPSKLIDYALVKKPILNIPRDFLPLSTIDEFLAGDYHNQLIVQNVEQYNITNVADQFCSL